MKTLKISLITFSVLLILIIANCIYVQRVTDRLDSYISEIENEDFTSEDCIMLIDNYNNYWKKNECILKFSVSNTIIYRASDLISSMRSYYENGEESDFRTTLGLLRNLNREIKKPESFW